MKRLKVMKMAQDKVSHLVIFLVISRQMSLKYGFIIVNYKHPCLLTYSIAGISVVGDELCECPGFHKFVLNKSVHLVQLHI